MMMCGFPLGAMVICLPSNCWPVTVGKTVPTAGSGPESGICVKPVPETAIWPYSRFPFGTTVPPLGDAPPPEEPLLRPTATANTPTTKTIATMPTQIHFVELHSMQRALFATRTSLPLDDYSRGYLYFFGDFRITVGRITC